MYVLEVGFLPHSSRTRAMSSMNTLVYLTHGQIVHVELLLRGPGVCCRLRVTWGDGVQYTRVVRGWPSDYKTHRIVLTSAQFAGIHGYLLEQHGKPYRASYVYSHLPLLGCLFEQSTTEESWHCAELVAHVLVMYTDLRLPVSPCNATPTLLYELLCGAGSRRQASES